MSAEAPAQRLSDPTQAPPQYVDDDGSDIRPYEMKRVIMIKRALVAGLFALVLLTAVVVTAVVTKAASASGGPQAASVSENGAMPSFLAMRGQSTQEPDTQLDVCDNGDAKLPDGSCCDWDNLGFADGHYVCTSSSHVRADDASTSSCFPNEVCYVGDDAANDCCSGAVITDLSCSMTLQCSICEKAVGVLLPEIKAAADTGSASASATCDTMIPAAITSCQALLLGPEDPFADVCSVVLSLACPKVESMISDATENLSSLTATTVCSTIGYCESSSSTPAPSSSDVRGSPPAMGRRRSDVRAMNLDTGVASVFGQACGCVASGSCSAREEGCCSQAWSDASWWTKRTTCGVLGLCG